MSIENIPVFFCAFLTLNIFVITNIMILKDALRIVPYFVFTTVGAKRVPLVHSTPQSCPIFAYREADAPLLCLCSASVGAEHPLDVLHHIGTGHKTIKPLLCKHIVVSGF